MLLDARTLLNYKHYIHTKTEIPISPWLVECFPWTLFATGLESRSLCNVSSLCPTFESSLTRCALNSVSDVFVLADEEDEARFLRSFNSKRNSPFSSANFDVSFFSSRSFHASSLWHAWKLFNICSWVCLSPETSFRKWANSSRSTAFSFRRRSNSFTSTEFMCLAAIPDATRKEFKVRH